jgi:hypothetical protein
MTLHTFLMLLGSVFIMFRSSLGGLVLGGVITMALMHLYPEYMGKPYEWVGAGLAALGLG